MRIGIDAKSALFNKSGRGSYGRSMIKALTTHFPENEYLLYAPSMTNAIQFIESENIEFVTPSGRMNRVFPSLWRRMRLSELLEMDGVNIYHGMNNTLPTNIGKTSVKSVLTVHDIAFARRPDLFTAIDRLFHLKKIRIACDYASKIIVPSTNTKNDLIEVLEIEDDKISVIPQFVDPIFKEKVHEEKLKEISWKYNLPGHFMLFVGRLDERKNLMLVLQALRKSDIEMPLVVIGRPTPHVTKLKTYVFQNRMRNVNFITKTDFEDMPAIYQLAELFVYPSYYEGFGLPILEAMHSGVPIICSNSSCLPETAGNAAEYIDPNITDNLIQQIEYLIANPQRRTELTESAGNHVKQFDEKGIISKTMDIYKSII